MSPILSAHAVDRKPRPSSADRWARAIAAATLLPAALAMGACGPANGAASGPASGPRTAPERAAGAVDTAGAVTAGEVTAGEDAPDVSADPAAAAATPLLLGIDVALGDSAHLVRGRRVGLITNHTGLSWPRGSATSTIDRLARSPDVELVALFSPEHGIRGAAEAGESIDHEVDERTGLPIHSLYGETRKPTPEMLEGIDVLAFDIQDIGTRYYTYVWTMALAMEAAGEAGIEFLVLDRPNPIGGDLVQGNVLDPAFSTFVGLYPVPMRHGLTAGELARMLVGEFGIDGQVRVAPMEGWSRDDWYDETGLPFVAPSPNMPSLESATHYPGTCLFEGTNLSVGRGTDRAFQQIGAPWLDAERVAGRLNAAGLAGVRFEAITFVPRSPGDRKFDGTEVRGLRFVTTDRERYDPTLAATAALIEIHRAHPDRLEWLVSHFDRLAGTDRVRQQILAGAELEEVTRWWPAESRAFEVARKAYLLYR